MKSKGLKDILEENPTLTGKLTYEEFQNGIISYSELNDGVEEAYKTYKQVIENMSK